MSTVAILAFGCTAESGDDAPRYDHLRTVELAHDQTCVPLFAGQHIDVGTVCTAIDNSLDTSAQCGPGSAGAMQVTYALTGGWELLETHLAAGNEFADIPANNLGNPMIGQFPHASGDITGATTYQATVPLCTFDLDASLTACEPAQAYLAAHAAVRRADGNGGYQTETAWGDGERIVEQGSWAEYFNMELECTAPAEDPSPPSVLSCETAFVLAGDGTETCFIGADFDGDGEDDGFRRWGWSNGPLSPGSTREWPIYAAAGQCNLGAGELVGHLTVEYDGSTATITFERVGDFILDEEHLYVGNEPLPSRNNGRFTVAPGQYPVVNSLEQATTTVNSVTGLSDDIYVVYHAVACGTYGGGGGGGDGGDGGGSDGDGGVDDGGGSGATDDGTGGVGDETDTAETTAFGDTGGGDGGDDGAGETGDDGAGPGGELCDPDDPLVAMSDDFTGELSSWDVYRPSDATVAVSGGQLVIEPNAYSWWYGNDEAVHVNQLVSGDFAMTSQVTVTNLAGGPAVPGAPYRIGGLMLRDPQASDVNSYHMGLGNMNTGALSIASKSTDDSRSTIGVQQWDGTRAEMRICRVGPDVQGLIRLPGEAHWSIIDWHVRSDLPDVVAAGPIGYGGMNADPDLRVTFDSVDFMPIQTLHDCMKDPC